MPYFWQLKTQNNNFLLVCWFLCKNLPNFVPPAWKLHNLYWHSMYIFDKSINVWRTPKKRLAEETRSCHIFQTFFIVLNTNSSFIATMTSIIFHIRNSRNDKNFNRNLYIKLSETTAPYRAVASGGTGAPCVQMDFTRTFQTTTNCNNINHVWSHFYKRRPWANIFDTDICRGINILKKAKYTTYI